MPSIPVAVAGFVLLLTVLRALHIWLRKHSNATPLPPGPKPLPFIGNVHQMPEDYQEKEFFSWGRKFGSLVYARALNRDMVIINSLNVARDLMEKRGAIYSERPRFVLLNEMLDMDCAIPMLPYGNRFRKCRKWVQDSFSNVALLTYRVKQRRETNVLLKGVLARPEALASHIARFTQALIMDIAYGHQVTTDDDKYIEMGEKGNHAFATAGSAGSMLVDFFPILKHYPTWLPGSAFKIRAINAAKLLRTMHDVPYNEVKYQLKHGNPQLSFTSTLLDSYFHDGEFGTLTEQDEKDIKGSAGTLYSAGTETMASSMNTFVLAMLLYPNVYRKAQEEMDRVLGLSRLPELEDRESLPYLNAVIKETYRWLPPLPMTLPHMSSQDDVYNGYRIPKQTLVIGNAWGMARDENMYPDPESFCPERFLDLTNEDIADPRLYVFGFGRRLCPGKDFADSCIYMVLANIIATMNINKVKDQDGNEITPPREFTSGFATRPKPFKCVLVPRSQNVAEMVSQLDIQTSES